MTRAAPILLAMLSLWPVDTVVAAPQPDAVVRGGDLKMAGTRIAYRAIAGTLIVRPRGAEDVAPDRGVPAQASIFYTAYFKQGAPAVDRPLTFLYNGGPGSASFWLHIGAFGPRRVIAPDDGHAAGPPYRLVDNPNSLLDASDLVFIDAPGTGFSRVAGSDKGRAFYGVDADAFAFRQFIKAFLSRYARWSSPKYLLGESYGTARTAVLVNALQREDGIDVNGVIMLSQILNFDLNPEGAEANPGQDQPYVLALPSMAAAAWYHRRIDAHGADLADFLREAEHFALTDYAQALEQGATLEPAVRQAVAARMGGFIGLPIDYIMKAELRVTAPMFAKKLLEGEGRTVGRLDTRFSGPDMNPLSREADYDPQSAAITSAYVSSFNAYVRSELQYGSGLDFRPRAAVFDDWDFHHAPPGAHLGFPGATNVIGDLAAAMKYNPNLRIMLNVGYFDLATPYFQGVYELRHLPIPSPLQANIIYRFYRSGHMVYANEAAASQLHDNVAAFIRSTTDHGRRDQLDPKEDPDGRSIPTR